MVDQPIQLAGDDGSSATVVELQRLGSIKTIEVTKDMLDALKNAVGEESESLAFFTFVLGLLIPVVVTWRTTALSDEAKSFYPALMTVLALAALRFGWTWWRKRSQREKLLEEIPKRTTRGSGARVADSN